MMRSIQGLTMLELITVVAIASIMVFMAAPSFSTLIAQQRINYASNQLLLSLQYAKRQAIESNQPIKVCPSIFNFNPPNSTIAQCDQNKPSWHHAYSVMNESPQIILKTVMNAGRQGLTIDQEGRLAIKNGTTPPKMIRFLPHGVVSHGGGTDIEFCDPKGTAERKIVHISATTGMASIKETNQRGCS